MAPLAKAAPLALPAIAVRSETPSAADVDAGVVSLTSAGDAGGAAAARDAGKAAGAGKDGGGASAKGAGDAAAAAAGKPSLKPKAMTGDNDPDRPKVETTSFNRGGDAIEALSGDAASEVSKFAFSGKEGTCSPSRRAPTMGTSSSSSPSARR